MSILWHSWGSIGVTSVPGSQTCQLSIGFIWRQSKKKKNSTQRKVSWVPLWETLIWGERDRLAFGDKIHLLSPLPPSTPLTHTPLPPSDRLLLFYTTCSISLSPSPPLSIPRKHLRSHKVNTLCHRHYLASIFCLSSLPSVAMPDHCIEWYAETLLI